MAFPEDSLDVRVVLTIGGVRTDVTGHVYTRDPIQTVCGMSVQGTGVDPASCALTLNNKDGRYSPRNPASPYYGMLGRNTPLEVTIAGPESYLALDGTAASYAETPDTSVLDIVGDIDVRVEGEADWYVPGTQVLLGKWDSSVSQRSFILMLQDAALLFLWSPDGTISHFVSRALPSLPARAVLRVTLDVSNGSGGWTCRMYWATSLAAADWTEIGEPFVESGTTSIFAGTAPLRAASSSFTITPPWLPVMGRVYRAEVRSGINGPLVADLDARLLAPGTAGFTDSVGRVWALAGAAEITNREPLFTGEVSEWPPRWNTGGTDAWVPVQAAGILRRLGRGRRPIQSTLRRRIPSADRLLAYWPLEEGQAATTQAYSPVEGVQPLVLTGADWAADDTLGGSSALPKLKSSAAMSASVPYAASTGWQVEFVYNLPKLPATQTEIIRIAVTGATMTTVVVYASTSGIRLEARDSDGGLVAGITYTNATALAAFVGGWNRLTVYSGDAGGGITRLQATWRDVSTNLRSYASTSGTSGQGRVAAVTGTWGVGTEGMGIGHLAVFDTPGSGVIGVPPTTTIFEGADDGFARETALNRLARLATEESAQLNLTWLDGDTAALSELMGPQRPDTLPNLLKEAAETDGGILYERMDRLGLVYRDRASLYNQAPMLTLDYAAGDLTPPLEPVEDDSTLANDVIVSRAGGSSGHVVIDEGPLSVLPPEKGGVGIYEQSFTLSLGDDSQAEPIAGWKAHLGTWDEPRYPSVVVKLNRRPELIPAVLRLRIGDLIRITNPPIWAGAGPLDLHVLQIKHTPRPRAWDVALVCVPAGPWQVGVVGDPDRGRVDTAGSALAMAVDADDTTLSVTAGSRWADSATYPSDFPFDARVGGEVVTVTAITGTTSPQSWTVTRSVNGITKSHAAGADIRLAYPTIVAL